MRGGGVPSTGRINIKLATHTLIDTHNPRQTEEDGLELIPVGQLCVIC